MGNGRTPPYLQPKKGSVNCSLWRQANGGHIGDGDTIAEWDQNMILVLARSIEVDFQAMRQARISSGAKVMLIPTWWSDGTGLRGRGEPQEIVIDAASNRYTYEVGIAVRGVDLARNIQLRTALVLIEPTDEMLEQPLAAHRPGSVLWEDSIRIRLEGVSPRFPISVVDFNENQIGPANACWIFDWSPIDLNLPAMATMRLLVNSSQKIFHAAITSSKPSPSQVAIRSALKHAVALEMIYHALEHADELEHLRHDLMPDSAGQVLLDLVQRIYPGVSLTACADRRRQFPGEFSAEAQAKLAVFGEKVLSEDIT